MIDFLFQVAANNVCMSLVLAIVAVIVGKTLKRPVLTHLLWLLVFLKLLIPPVIFIPTIPIPLIDKTAPTVNLNINEQQEMLTPMVNEDKHITYSSPELKSVLFNHGKQLLFLLWLSGSMVIFFWSIFQACRFHKLLKKESETASTDIQAIAAKAASSLGLKAAPIIHTTSANISPMVWWTGGMVWLVIPVALIEQMDEGQLQLILSHELAHISRWDYLCRWIEWMACVCFWWNPVVWWARHNLRVNEEICCDELVLSSMKPEPFIYGDTLVKAIDILLCTPRFQMVMASNFNGGDLLKRRLKLIISKNQRRSKLRWLNACILLAAVVLLPFGLMQAKDNDNNEIEYHLSVIEKELDKASEKLSEELEKKEAFKNAQAQMQKSITSDLSFRESLKKARLQSIDSDYALLYERLDLSPEELEQFKSIVATWREDDSDNTVPLILSATTDEEKEEARRKRQLDRDKYKEQHIELMGEEKFNIYNDFRMSRFDRGTLERFAQTLPPENRIDNDMMFNLIGRMSEARISIEKKMGFHDIITFPSDNREDSAEREADMAVQVYEKYTEIGDEMLPPEHTEPYKAYIAKERESYLKQIKVRTF